jgi:hypothetical protein
VLSASSCDDITSALKMGAAHFSETLASTKESTRRLNPTERHQNRHHCEHFNSMFLFMASMFSPTILTLSA